MKHVLSFAAGFVATLVFHQGLIAVLHASGLVPFAPYNLAATWPFGVPQVISLAFWGGVWAVLLAVLLGRRRGLWWWGGWIGLGAIGPTAVALLVVFPLKGIAFSAAALVLGLVLNGFWGFGCALLLTLAGRLRRAPG